MKKGTLALQPDQPVYKEDASKLLDAQGKLVTKW